VFTLAAIYLTGGAVWLHHFWFAVAFALVAVPWPVPFEQGVIQSLMRLVAAASVETMRWCGFPAFQQGNVINLGSAGVVGFEEACSGVRSLQTMLMVSLFLGEIWYRLLWRRLILVVLGLFLALVFNVGRALTLSWITSAHGFGVANVWHDRVGAIFLGLMLGSFGILAYLWRDRIDDVTPELEAARGASLSSISWRLSATLLSWLVVVWIATELWYRSGEKLRGGKSEIVLRWPENEAGFKDIPIPRRTGIILRNDEGRSATWKAGNGDTWSMVYLKWKAQSAAVQLARAHTPDLCLPAAGGRLEFDLGVVLVPAGELSLPAHAYTFRAGGWPIHVFYIRVGDDAGSYRLPTDIEELTIPNRIRAALARRRNRGQQVVEVAVTSFKSPEEVAASFKEFARSALEISTTRGS
jgi:exosortase